MVSGSRSVFEIHDLMPLAEATGGLHALPSDEFDEDEL